MSKIFVRVLLTLLVLITAAWFAFYIFVIFLPSQKKDHCLSAALDLSTKNHYTPEQTQAEYDKCK